MNEQRRGGIEYRGHVLCINLWVERFATSDIPAVLRQIAQHFEDQDGHGANIYFGGEKIGNLYTAVRVTKEPKTPPA